MRQQEPTTPRADRTTRALLACGVAGGPLFVAVFLLAGALRPGYDATRAPVSLLTLGPGGWAQVANFLVFGTLTIAFAVGLRRTGRHDSGPHDSGPHDAGRSRTRATPLLLAGAGLLGSGLFTPDPAGGYPPGAATTQTWHGAVHGWCAILFVGGLTAACLVRTGNDGRRWRRLSTLTAILIAASFLASLAVGPQIADLPGAGGGLLERVAGVAGPVWMCALAVRTRRTYARGPTGPPVRPYSGA